jgi:hypothetical protein
VLAISQDQLSAREDTFHYKARQLRRYLCDTRRGLWDDRQFPLRDSPGVIIIPKDEEGTVMRFFPVLLRR